MLVKQAREMLAGWGRSVRYQWVPRESNQMADWLSNVAALLESDVTLPDLQALQLRGELPTPAPEELSGPGVGLGVEGG